MNKDAINNEQVIEEDFAAVRRVLEGDNTGFDELQKKYKKIITILIRRMIRDEDDVQDLVQESFIKAFRALSSFQFGYSFSAWLYRIASNTCIDFLRKRRFNIISIDQNVSSDEDDHYIQIKDEEAGADTNLLLSERKAALEEAIIKLPENYRIVIQLRHTEEMDYSEIAEKLNLPLGTVKAHLFRARKMLYDLLKMKADLFKD